MAKDLDLPWPLCLGSFDEESCRYFLYEIGSRIVPNYPFSFGIEEVYGLILDRYGLEGSSDVISLLEELLEDDGNATGLGDDGDIWRSWRHNWRHRSDNVQNPFIPRYGPLVFRPATPARIRRLKAENYIQERKAGQTQSWTVQERNMNVVGSLSSEVGECNFVQLGSHSSVQDMARHRSMGCLGCRDSSVDVSTLPITVQTCSLDESNKNFSDQRIRSSSATEFDPTSSILFQMLEGHSCCSTDLQSGDRSSMNVKNSIDEQEIEAKPKNISHHGSPLTSDSNTKDRYWQLNKSRRMTFHEGWGERLSDKICDAIPSSPERDSPVPLRFKQPQNDESKDLATVTTIPQIHRSYSCSTPGLEKRAENRQAQLIDGTIFSSTERHAKHVTQNKDCALPAPDVSPGKTSVRGSGSPVQQKGNALQRWTQDMRRLFHRDHGCKQNTTIQESQHSLEDCSSTVCWIPNMSVSRKRQSQPSSGMAVRSQPGNLWLDGGSDPAPEFNAHVDLNKPLPLSPEDVVRSMSSRSHLTSSRLSKNDSSIPSAASTTSSLSRSSSTRKSRGVLHDLPQSDMLASHELPPICEIDIHKQKTIDPQKFEIPPASPVSYTSISQANPFSDIQMPPSPTRCTPSNSTQSQRPFNCAIPNITTPLQKPRVLVSTSTVPVVESNRWFDSLPESKSNIVRRDQNDTSRYIRGRDNGEPRLRVALDAPNESETPKTPSKRSRSPIKRFLGLPKSHSTNKIERSEDHAQQNVPVSGAKKESLKKWSDRLRYAFLTADQGQLQQEELIEEHNSDLTTLRSQNSSFLISLEPPLQAKVQSEIELIVTVTANRFLMREAKAGRISLESVAKTRELWSKMNRPQVVEFHYDQLTQHNLVISNLDQVKLYGDAATDAVAINSTLRGWKIMAREMSVRTFCSPDSVIRKHLHDAHRVLELLGAPLVTFHAYEKMQLRTLATISSRQKERMGCRSGSTDRYVSSSSILTLGGHRRNASEGSYAPYPYDNYPDYSIAALQTDKTSMSPSSAPISVDKVRKATGAEGAIMSLPTKLERSRDPYALRMGTTKTGLTMKEI